MKRDTRILLGLGIGCALLIVVAGLTYSATKPHRSADAVMPDLRGVSLTDARKRLADIELKAQTVDDTGTGRHVMFDSNWTVTNQTPSAGATLADLKKITLGVVKKGEAPRAATSDTPSPTTNSAVKTSTTATEPPAKSEPETHNACSMLDPAALEAAHMSPALDKPLTDADEDETTYGCENVLSEVMLEIHLRPNAISACRAADFATRIPDPGYSNPFPNAVRLPYDDPMGGAKVIATETGVSRISWSHDAYWILLEINSDPVVPGLQPRHPFDTLNQLADRIATSVEQHLATGNW